MGVGMELRHLRYFVAVAEAGSLTVAAEQRLHTSQPSLSRQIRDLENEVGAQLLRRSARGIDLVSWRDIDSGPLDRGAPTNRRSQAPHFGNRPEQRSCTSPLGSISR